MSPCQKIGDDVARIGADGLLVPSARLSGGSNLVIYPEWWHDIMFDIVETEINSEADAV